MRHLEILARTDWSTVEHAYGRASEAPQTPEILAALLSDDAACQARALRDLYHVVHHQDTIYSATPPAVDFVVAVLDDPRTLAPVPSATDRRADPKPLRAMLLDWLTSVMDAVAWLGERMQGEPEAVAACRAARPSVHQAARAMCADPDPVVVSAALGTLACVLDAPELEHHRPEAAAWLREHALASSDRRVRVMAVMILAAWGSDLGQVLHHDPDLVVRANAALSPRHSTDPEGTRALLDLLASPADAAWCQQVLQYFGRPFPFKVMPAVIAQAPLDELVGALAVILSDPPLGTYAGDWGGRLRAKAFPDGFPPPRPFTPAQRALLDLLAEHTFGPAAPPAMFADARVALSDLVPEGATFRA